jgi:hypothetical protein
VGNKEAFSYLNNFPPLWDKVFIIMLETAEDHPTVISATGM